MTPSMEIHPVCTEGVGSGRLQKTPPAGSGLRPGSPASAEPALR